MKKLLSLLQRAFGSWWGGDLTIPPIQAEDLGPHVEQEETVTEPLYHCNCIVFQASRKPKHCQHVEAACKDEPS